MASHPEQLRIQIEDAIASAIPYDDYRLADANTEIELIDLLQGKGSSHYIAVFYTTGEVSWTSEFLNEVREEIMDTVAASITRKRVPNITFKVSNKSPDDFPDLSNK